MPDWSVAVQCSVLRKKSNIAQSESSDESGIASKQLEVLRAGPKPEIMRDPLLLEISNIFLN